MQRFGGRAAGAAPAARRRVAAGEPQTGDRVTQRTGVRGNSGRTAPGLMQRAVSLLARREHSRAELRRKLLRHLPPDDEVEAVDRVLDQLVAKDMLSDARFVQSRVRVRGQRYGVARIRQELRQHDLGPEAIGGALASLSQTEFERACSIWERKFGTAPVDELQRARQMRFLAARGFSSDTVIRVMKKARSGGA